MIQSAQQPRTVASHSRRPRDKKYTRVAITLHWLIAALIIYNLISGFLIWDLAREFFQTNRPWYVAGLTSHLSSGLTVLILTVARIFWRLTHEPPAYADDMKPWERHTAHFAHFFLYAAMLLMPLSGWAIVSANFPPLGSAGDVAMQQAQQAQRAAMAPPPAMPGAAASAPAPSGRPPGLPRLWWVGPRPPVIAPLENIGAEPGGLAPQKILHDEIAEWHKIGAWLTLFLLLLHVAGALKHQWVDRSPTLQRMGLGRWPKVSQEPDA